MTVGGWVEHRFVIERGDVDMDKGVGVARGGWVNLWECVCGVWW